MKLVVLDGYTLNPGDLSWDALRTFGDLTVYDFTPDELTVERAAGAEVVFTNKTKLREEHLCKLENLKYIGIIATGYDVVDVVSAKNHGIVVTNIPAYSTESVAQMAIALLLELTYHVSEHHNVVQAGTWLAVGGFSIGKKPFRELAGKTMGILGYGNIGKAVARLALAFGMKVLANSKTHEVFEKTDQPNFSYADKDTVFRESDVISLHCPLNPSSKELINSETIAKMKPTALLINTARGGLVREKDLADALNSGRIAGAGLDALTTEPPEATNPLLTAKNCIITPHIGWSTFEARERLMVIAADNLKAFVAGAPVNVVSK